jgi:hypothetical protein
VGNTVRRLVATLAILCWGTAIVIYILGFFKPSEADSVDLDHGFVLAVGAGTVLGAGSWLDRRIAPLAVSYELGAKEGFRRGVRAHERGEDNVRPLRRVTDG